MTNTQISTIEKYHMLRCLIAVAHVDGIMSEEEIAYLMPFLSRIPFTDEQRERLELDFDQPQQIWPLLAQINNPVVRAQVLYFARIIAHKDGVLSPSEDELITRLQIQITEGVDLASLKKDAHAATQQAMNMHDIRIDANRLEKGNHIIPYFYLLDRLLLALGIDLLR
jgi:uncharacterized membrane protein YebE (DUF533 family)